jgi:type II secretory pathway pseudopilin PulG
MKKIIPAYLYWALAAVFSWHGYLAYQRAYKYTHAWHAWLQQLCLDLGIVDNLMLRTYFLKTVGMIDLLVAILILSTPLLLAKNYKIISKSALIWMSLWGFFTAIFRLYFFQFFNPNVINKVGALGECLKRFPNFALAWIALAFLCNFTWKKSWTFSLLMISFLGYVCTSLGDIYDPEGLNIHLIKSYSSMNLYLFNISLNLLLILLFSLIFLKIKFFENNKTLVTLSIFTLLLICWSLDYWKDLPQLSYLWYMWTSPLFEKSPLIALGFYALKENGYEMKSIKFNLSNSIPKSQRSGFSILEVIVAVVILTIIGFAGFKIFQMSRQSSQKNLVALKMIELDAAIHRSIYEPHTYSNYASDMAAGKNPDAFSTAFSLNDENGKVLAKTDQPLYFDRDGNSCSDANSPSCVIKNTLTLNHIGTDYSLTYKVEQNSNSLFSGIAPLDTSSNPDIVPISFYNPAFTSTCAQHNDYFGVKSLNMDPVNGVTTSECWPTVSGSCPKGWLPIGVEHVATLGGVPINGMQILCRPLVNLICQQGYSPNKFFAVSPTSSSQLKDTCTAVFTKNMEPIVGSDTSHPDYIKTLAGTVGSVSKQNTLKANMCPSAYLLQPKAPATDFNSSDFFTYRLKTDPSVSCTTNDKKICEISPKSMLVCRTSRVNFTCNGLSTDPADVVFNTISIDLVRERLECALEAKVLDDGKL